MPAKPAGGQARPIRESSIARLVHFNQQEVTCGQHGHDTSESLSRASARWRWALRSANAQAPDPLVGTWHLDVAKSTYKPGPAPKSATVVITAAGKGLKIAIDAVGGDGKPMKWSYANDRDGKDTPVTGNPCV